MINACKKCRREGEKLLLKGDRCLGPKCAVTRRSYAPGQHGQGFHSKMSEYGKQLREKQKCRRIYGMSEDQFSKYVAKGNAMTGNKTENLMSLLETRIDNVVFRLGFASSRSQSRQYVSHGLFTLNGKTITIPSIIVKAGDVIRPKNDELFKELSLNTASTWIDADTKKLTGTIKHLPTKDEIDTQINASLIIEFYSR